MRGGIGRIRLNRPETIHALNHGMCIAMTEALLAWRGDPAMRLVMIDHAAGRGFCAGGDIRALWESGRGGGAALLLRRISPEPPSVHRRQAGGFAQAYGEDLFAGWSRVTATRKPWIAAVAGFALGGGCEVAVMADFILAAGNAKFGQPEIKLGVAPGMGGSQRLTRAVGKAKAIEMCLTGRMMDAAEAERSGLVSRVVPLAELEADALKTRPQSRQCRRSRRRSPTTRTAIVNNRGCACHLMIALAGAQRRLLSC